MVITEITIGCNVHDGGRIYGTLWFNSRTSVLDVLYYWNGNFNHPTNRYVFRQLSGNCSGRRTGPLSMSKAYWYSLSFHTWSSLMRNPWNHLYSFRTATNGLPHKGPSSGKTQRLSPRLTSRLMGFFSGYCKRRIPVDFAKGEVPIKGFFPPIRTSICGFIYIARVHFRGGNVGI